jgi:hypothetical protein
MADRVEVDTSKSKRIFESAPFVYGMLEAAEIARYSDAPRQFNEGHVVCQLLGNRHR